MLEEKYGQLNIWEFNKEFLLQQCEAGKEIRLTHDPFDSNIRVGFYKMECDLLESLGYTFEVYGEYWRAVLNG